MEKYKVIIFGCGVMGRKTARDLLEKASFEIVGAVDIAPELFGKDLGEILNPPKTLGILIGKDLSVFGFNVKACPLFQ